MRTKDKLAKELRLVAQKAQPKNAVKYEALARRAETGEFDDYGTVHVCGPAALYQELISHGFSKFAQRVANGEFDATIEESDEWARSPEAQEAAKEMTAEKRKIFGLDLIN